MFEKYPIRTLLAIILLLALQPVFAAPITWTGNTSTDWATGTNWSGNSLPANGDDVTIPTSPAGGRMPTISATYQIGSLTIETGATLTHTGGTLSVIGGTTSITGIYSISGGTFLSDESITVNSGGLISQSGGTIHMASTIGASPTDNITIDANGDFNQSSGTTDTDDFTNMAGSPNGVFTQSGGTLRINHDFKNSGTFSSSAGTIEFMGDAGAAGFPAGVTSSNTQFFNVVINSGVDPNFDNNAISFNVAGDWTNNSTSTNLQGAATTVIFNGSGAQTIGGSESTTFRNLTINKSGGTATLSIDQSLINGDLTISGGTFDIGTYTINRSAAGGMMSLSNGCTLRLADDAGGQTGSNFPLDYSSVSLGSTSTVEYYGSNAITQTVYAGTNYGHLTLTNGSGSGSAGKNTTANLTVNGNLTINSLTVFSPGAANTVAGSGTLMGSGTAQVTRTIATADFNTQYPITSKTLTNLIVDYFATVAQTVNAHNYYDLIISGARTTNSITLANSGTIGISGTFTPSATFSSGNYIITGSTVNFNGSGAQNIPSFTFNNLTVSTSAKTATGVINVNEVFELNSSVLTTTSGNMLIINDGGTATGASLTAYVNGPVRKVGDDAFTFPVGKSGTGYMLVGISAPSVATDAFTAEYMRNSGTSLGSVTAPGLFRVSNCDYWNLDRTTGTSAVDVTLSWNGYSNCDMAVYVNDLATLSIAHFNGTNWDTQGSNSTTGNVSSGTITWNGVSTFSPFGLGTSSDFTNPLEVNFTSIKAFKLPGGNRIEWVNQTETNIDHYEIERSLNDGQFVVVRQVKATTNNSNKASYDWLDQSILNKSIFYRIKAVSTDGKTSYSTTVRINRGQRSELLIYPNPVTDKKLTIQTGNMGAGKFQLQVVDMIGRNIFSQSLTNNGTNANIVIDLPAYIKPGMYSLRLTGNNQSLVKTFIVQTPSRNPFL